MYQIKDERLKINLGLFWRRYPQSISNSDVRTVIGGIDISTPEKLWQIWAAVRPLWLALGVRKDTCLKASRLEINLGLSWKRHLPWISIIHVRTITDEIVIDPPGKVWRLWAAVRAPKVGCRSSTRYLCHSLNTLDEYRTSLKTISAIDFNQSRENRHGWDRRPPSWQGLATLSCCENTMVGYRSSTGYSRRSFKTQDQSRTLLYPKVPRFHSKTQMFNCN